MIETSALYQELLSTPGTATEIRIQIGEKSYGEDSIFSCAVTGSLFGSGFSVGSCVSRELALTLRETSENIARMARIEPKLRLVGSDGRTSEWIAQGVYYIDTRSEDYDGATTLTCYDAMLKSEQVWWDPSLDAGEWPKTQAWAVSDIAARMGVAVDSRTVIHPTYLVEYPNDYTMREVLGYIAAAHGGNWIMTPEGKLRLVPLLDLPPETRFLVDGADGAAIRLGGVRILV